MNYVLDNFYRKFSNRKTYYSGNLIWDNNRILISLDIKISKSDYVTVTNYLYDITGLNITTLKINHKKYRNNMFARLVSNFKNTKLDVYLIDTHVLKYCNEKKVLQIPKCYSQITKLLQNFTNIEIVLPIPYINPQEDVVIEHENFTFIFDNTHPNLIY